MPGLHLCLPRSIPLAIDMLCLIAWMDGVRLCQYKIHYLVFFEQFVNNDIFAVLAEVHSSKKIRKEN